MRLLLITIGAVAAVHLVAGNAHAESPNVITKSARALQLGRGTKHLRPLQSTQDDEEERVYQIPVDFGPFMERIMTSSTTPDSVLKSEAVTESFEKFYMNKVDSEEIYRAMESRAKPMRAIVQKAYVKFVNQKRFDELLKPVSSSDEVVQAQFVPKESIDPADFETWQEADKHPTEVLSFLKLDDGFLGKMSRWIDYVKIYNSRHAAHSITVIDALKKGGITEETLRGMLFSCVLRPQSVREHFSGTKMEKMLLDDQTKIRLEISKWLTKSWMDLNILPDQVFVVLGLSPKQETGFDFVHLNEWIHYVKIWTKQKTPNDSFFIGNLFLVLADKYSMKMLRVCAANLDEGDAEWVKQLKTWISYNKQN